MELAVTITNVKNQPPQWEKDSYSVVIPENTVRDTPIVVCWSGDGFIGTCRAHRYEKKRKSISFASRLIEALYKDHKDICLNERPLRLEMIIR